MIRARVKSLPPELQHANLCRLSPAVMDELDVRSGGLVLVERPGHADDLSSSDPQSRDPKKNGNTATTCLSRIWVRCPNIGKASGEDDLPFIEIDPGLMIYLDVKDDDVINLYNDSNKMILSNVTFETTSSLSGEEKAEVCRLIQHACWAVYPGAFFAVNLSGSPIDLLLKDKFMPPAVIGIGADVFILDSETSQALKYRKEINKLEMALELMRKQKKILDLEIKKLSKEQQKIRQEESLYDDILNVLSVEKTKFQSQIEILPQKSQLLREEITGLDRENQDLQDALNELESENVEFCNIDELKSECDSLRKTLKTEMENFEKKLKELVKNV